MEQNSSKSIDGLGRVNPRADARAWPGYAPRQASYFSASRPPAPVSPQTAKGPTLSQSSAAAQRIVSTPAPAQSASSFPANQQPRQNLPPNNSGSFDMLPSKSAFRSVPPRPAEPLPQSAPPQEPVYNQPVQFAPTVQPAHKSSTFALPTDLPAEFRIEEPAVEHIKKHGKLGLKLPSLAAPKVMAGMAGMIFILGAVVAFVGLRTNSEVKQQVRGIVSTQSSQPDEDGGITEGVPHEDGNPPSVAYYRTPNTYPRVMRINKISVESRVLALNIAPTGALKSPANIFDTGWYKDSAKPGEAGAMIIDGHISGPTRPGVFKNLGTLTKGDKIEIERGDGMKYTYTVTATKVYEADKLDMSSVMVPSVPGKPGLNIITCAGKFDPATNKYPDRTVVYAVIH